MRDLLLLLAYLLFAAVFSNQIQAQKDECGTRKDIAFLFGFDADPSSPAYAVSFLNGIARRLSKNKCNRIAVIVVSTEAKRLVSFSCQSSVCFSRGFTKIRQLKNKIASASPLEINHDVLLKGIQILSDDTFTGDRKEFKRVVVAVLSSGSKRQQKDFTIEDAFKDVQDISDQIIVVALKRANTMNLRSIAQDGDITSVPKFSNLINKKLIDKVYGMLSPLLPGALRSSSPAAASIIDYSSTVSADLQQTCDQYLVDIGFLVDSSGSLKADYDKEKLFVQRVSTRFNISDAGSHAGVILFSDVGYVDTQIRFNDFTNYIDFNNAVQNLPFYGYRTRIDLALKLANEQLFTLSSTSRPNVKKVLFLITDGRQNPTVENGVPLSPVKESIPLHDQNIQVFAVGVGRQINLTELEMITRSKNRVYTVDNFQALISDDFVRNVSKVLCSEAIKVNKTETIMSVPPPFSPTPPCKTSIPQVIPRKCHGNCSSCCGTQNIYINIFDGKAPNYFMQDVQVHQSGNNAMTNGVTFPHPDAAASGTINNSSGGSSTDNVVTLLKKLLPYQRQLTSTIEKLLSKAKSKPEMAINRKRRSLEESSLIDTLDAAGAKTFAKHITDYKLHKMMMKLQKHEKKVVIFVPRDEDISNEIKTNPQLVIDDMLKHHVGFIEDEKDGIVKCADGKHYLKLYSSVLTSNMAPTGVEDAFIQEDPVSTKEGTVYFIDRILHPPKLTLRQIMNKVPELSVFNTIFQSLGLWQDIKSPMKIEHYCESPTNCYKSKEMEAEFENTTKRLQFTIFAPTTRAMINYAGSLHQLTKQEIREGLASHVIPDIMLENSIDHNTIRCESTICHSNFIRCMELFNNTRMLRNFDSKTVNANILQSYRALDGVLYVIDKFIPSIMNISDIK